MPRPRVNGSMALTAQSIEVIVRQNRPLPLRRQDKEGEVRSVPRFLSAARSGRNRRRSRAVAVSPTTRARQVLLWTAAGGAIFNKDIGVAPRRYQGKERHCRRAARGCDGRGRQ